MGNDDFDYAQLWWDIDEHYLTSITEWDSLVESLWNLLERVLSLPLRATHNRGSNKPRVIYRCIFVRCRSPDA